MASTLSQSQMIRCALAAASSIASACASVPPGHAAVVTWPNAGVDPTPLTGGDSWVGPFAQVELLDLRKQEKNANFIATLADGARVQTGASLVTYRFASDELRALVREVGADPYASLISPVLQSTVRRVLGRLRLIELDTAHLRAAQSEISRIAAERLRPLHILLEDVDLRQVSPISTELKRAIVETSVLEQSVLQKPDDLRIVEQRAQALRVEGAGIAAANAAVSSTLDDNALQDLRARAWGELLASPGTRTVFADRAAALQEITP